MTHMATPQYKNIYPGGHEIYKFGKPFLGHHYYILGLFKPCSGVDKKERNQFYPFYSKITTPLDGGGSLNL